MSGHMQSAWGHVNLLQGKRRLCGRAAAGAPAWAGMGGSPSPSWTCLVSIGAKLLSSVGEVGPLPRLLQAARSGPNLCNSPGCNIVFDLLSQMGMGRGLGS